MRIIIIIASFISFTVMAPASMATPANTLSALYACEVITDKNAQLECFIVETAKLRAAETSGDIVTIDKQAVAEIEKESFGFNLPSLPKLKIFGKSDDAKKKEALKGHSFAIKRTSTIRNGYIRFYLENGQVWDQTQPVKIRNLGKENPDMLVIKNAAMGSFLARVNGKGTRIRVRRVE